MGIPCMDHIVVGRLTATACGKKSADFSNSSINMTAEEILQSRYKNIF